jgi:hypothetical protein
VSKAASDGGRQLSTLAPGPGTVGRVPRLGCPCYSVVLGAILLLIVSTSVTGSLKAAFAEEHQSLRGPRNELKAGNVIEMPLFHKMEE